MRVITGSARGRNLITLEGEDVRPTTDRVKEALFSIIQFEIEGRKVLDLFSGSGQLGIEALSRGAEKAVFVDSSKKSLEVTKKNLENTGLLSGAVLINRESISYLRSVGEKFDIVFLDPPYKSGLLQKALEEMDSVVSPGGVVICEAPKDEELPVEIGSRFQSKKYNYGKISLTVYRADN
ncbi:MAG: 16S rRNA (guanine(966)-N(2))-methyltransferase RsmD [Oscillospiraceae bacterium]|nr:16S rRNA (guanine(966)-N(2))-methyltransferase RsmD [Oscillospiraceae bacterium]